MAAWINLKIRASAAYAHSMSDALIELGALSCSIEDSYLNSENEEALLVSLTFQATQYGNTIRLNLFLMPMYLSTLSSMN